MCQGSVVTARSLAAALHRKRVKIEYKPVPTRRWPQREKLCESHGSRARSSSGNLAPSCPSAGACAWVSSVAFRAMDSNVSQRTCVCDSRLSTSRLPATSCTKRNTCDVNCRQKQQSRVARAAYLVELPQVADDDVSICFEYRQREKEVGMRAADVGPDCFPDLEDIVKGEFPLEVDQDPAKAKEQVQR